MAYGAKFDDLWLALAVIYNEQIREEGEPAMNGNLIVYIDEET